MTEVNKIPNRIFYPVLIIVILAQLVTTFYFCNKKQGYHYDENYSYYSSNVTNGLVPTDNEWKNSEDIRQEFYVTEGKEFEYRMVKLMQTYDVHPPLYYYALHTVCSLTKGHFSKWQGISVNIIFYILSIIMLILISESISDGNRLITLGTVLLFGFSPALISGVTFIRMYMMLTFFCMLIVYIHLKGLRDGARTPVRFYIPVTVITYLGFMTHYYFIVFMFFAAAYMTLYLFVRKESRKESFVYAGCVILGIALEIITYPACLSHIFRGYRGTEAIGAFLDIANLKERAGLFVGLLDEYVLCRSFYILLLLVIILALAKYRKKGSIGWNHQIALLITVTAGYFAVVLKTALQNAEEAVRYEMPIYGLLILLIVYAIVYMGANGRIGTIAIPVVLLIALAMQITGLANDKVLFLYPEDAENNMWASERTDDTVIYIYDYPTYWKVWDDAHELAEYKKIFFIDMNNSDPISDEDICSADHMYAYVMRTDEADDMLQKIISLNPNVDSAVKIRELKFVDLYELN